MKAAVVHSFSDVRIEEIDIPKIGPGDALVKMKACGICSGDVTPWYINRKAPVVLGHEPAGVIDEVGEHVQNFKEGDRVFIHHHAPCLNCRHCMRGNFSMCRTWRRSHIVPGGIAEYVKVPEINLQNDTIKLPDSLSFEDGALIEPTACSVKALKRAEVQKGDTVLVIGLGFMGQLNVILSRYYGADRVIAADLVPFRLESAVQFGADHAVDVSKDNLKDKMQEYTDGIMADVVIVGPGSISAIESGIECAGFGSTVVLFTPTPEGEILNIEPYHLYFNEINLICSYSCGPDDTRSALHIIEKGIVPTQKLITHRYPIEQTQQAYRKTSEAKDSLKTLILL